MKVFMMLAFAVVLTVSCHKNNVSCRDEIVGKWELRELSGGIAGTLKYQPGNGIIYLFDENRGYQYISPGSPVLTGTYEIKKAGGSGDWLLQLHYTYNGQPQLENDSVRFSGNKLIFLPLETCCDMPTVTYERLP
jgi:hypothetical protein